MAAQVAYDAFSLGNALCVLFWFFDAMERRRWLQRLAQWAMAVVLLVQTGWLFDRLHLTGAVLDRFDAALWVSWVILLVAWFASSWLRVDLLPFLASVVSFALVVLAPLAPGAAASAQVRSGDLLLLHIAFALASYVAFAFSFVFAVMYLVQSWSLRHKRWTSWYFRLLPLATLERYTFRAVFLGLPFLMMAMVFGVLWSVVAFGRVYWHDPKLVATSVLWLSYAVCLWLRRRTGWADRALVAACAACFGGVMVNFMVVSNLSAFHHTG
ncbi:hypothetical protein GCM10010885_02530 [Alicyclobacillus cellulosilyticus]|uniref:Cytochrome c assembly protein domain-containing protein n=1 Tax=Alicyclobacillus cellulosilyticus TaxID=1003997 RepID=A0A917NEW2_9BACL|nr:cytochrome c biogenesis protein CcsA [Alicyclobacillus cellulosilyticus]GGI96365.1 hypothetical protein GCM10010885_02530 [Alicyclobacillus cellulosilyticus]